MHIHLTAMWQIIKLLFLGNKIRLFDIVVIFLFFLSFAAVALPSAVTTLSCWSSVPEYKKLICLVHTRSYTQTKIQPKNTPTIWPPLRLFQRNEWYQNQNKEFILQARPSIIMIWNLTDIHQWFHAIGCWISEQLWGKYLKLTCPVFLEKWSKSDNDSGCHLGSSCHRCFVELLSWHLSDAQQWLIVFFSFKPPLILSVTMDQTSPILELKWYRASVNPRDFPPTTHHSQRAQANGKGDPVASEIQSLHSFVFCDEAHLLSKNNWWAL